jgi:hypothetical protein
MISGMYVIDELWRGRQRLKREMVRLLMMTIQTKTTITDTSISARRPRQAIVAEVVAQQQPQNEMEAARIAAGLQRFLQMAAEDREDEWDSDELEGDDDLWAIPDAPPRVQQPGVAQAHMPFLLQRR